LKATLDRWFREDHLDNFEGRLLTPLTLNEASIPDADIIVATAWQTAEWVALYPPAKGKKFYFIQHHEIWNAARDRVDATWKLPMTKIVISKWLKRLGEEQFGVAVKGPLLNPVDRQLFYSVNRPPNPRLRIGMLYHYHPWKGFLDGLKAFERTKQQVPDLQLVILSSERRASKVPKDAEFHYRPKQRRLRDIYGSCDVWLCPSWSEGFHLPPFEAMACGCALVSTRVGGVDDLCVHEESALISEPRNPEALAANLVRVLKNPELRSALARRGGEVASLLNWDDQAAALESFFRSVL
jgi:glycosyltransferase involved in cell wall biosynthesis